MVVKNPPRLPPFTANSLSPKPVCFLPTTSLPLFSLLKITSHPSQAGFELCSQDDLQLQILLPLPPERWDYRSVALFRPIYVVLGIKPMALCL